MELKIGDIVYLIEDTETIQGVKFSRTDELTVIECSVLQLPDDILYTCKREDGETIITSPDTLRVEKPFEACMNPPVDPSTEDGSPSYIQTVSKEEHAEMHKFDPVNHPSHYESGKFECIEVMEEALGYDAVRDFCICNAFKYLYRHKRKNGYEDIKKAQWYINKYIEMTEKAKENGLEGM